MGFFIALLFFTTSHAQEFLAPTHLTCISDIPFTVVGADGRSAVREAGSLTLKISATASVTFGGTTKIAKLFPESGLDGMLFEKNNWAIETNGGVA